MNKTLAHPWTWSPSESHQIHQRRRLFNNGGSTPLEDLVKLSFVIVWSEIEKCDFLLYIEVRNIYVSCVTRRIKVIPNIRLRPHKVSLLLWACVARLWSEQFSVLCFLPHSNSPSKSTLNHMGLFASTLLSMSFCSPQPPPVSLHPPSVHIPWVFPLILYLSLLVSVSLCLPFFLLSEPSCNPSLHLWCPCLCVCVILHACTHLLICDLVKKFLTWCFYGP